MHNKVKTNYFGKGPNFNKWWSKIKPGAVEKIEN